MNQFSTRGVFDAIFNTDVFTGDSENKEAKQFIARTALGSFSAPKNDAPVSDFIVTASSSLAVAHLFEKNPIMNEMKAKELFQAVRLVTPSTKLLQSGVEAMFKEECKRIGLDKTLSVSPIKRGDVYFDAVHNIHMIAQKGRDISFVTDKTYQAMRRANAVHQSFLHQRNSL